MIKDKRRKPYHCDDCMVCVEGSSLSLQTTITTVLGRANALVEAISDGFQFFSYLLLW